MESLGPHSSLQTVFPVILMKFYSNYMGSQGLRKVLQNMLGRPRERRPIPPLWLWRSQGSHCVSFPLWLMHTSSPCSLCVLPINGSVELNSGLSLRPQRDRWMITLPGDGGISNSFTQGRTQNAQGTLNSSYRGLWVISISILKHKGVLALLLLLSFGLRDVTPGNQTALPASTQCLAF